MTQQNADNGGRVTIRLDAETLGVLRRLADQERRSLSSVVRLMVERGLTRAAVRWEPLDLTGSALVGVPSGLVGATATGPRVPEPAQPSAESAPPKAPPSPGKPLSKLDQQRALRGQG